MSFIHSFRPPTPVCLWCGVRTYLLLNKLQFFWRAPNRIRKCWYLCENVNTPTAVLGPHFFVSLMLVSCPVLFCRWDGDVRRRWERTSLSALVCAADCGRRLQIYYWGHWAKSEDRLFITVIHHPATKKEQHFCGEWPCVWKVLFSDLIRWLNPELSIPLLFLLSSGLEWKLAPAAKHILFAGNYTLWLDIVCFDLEFAICLFMSDLFSLGNVIANLWRSRASKC